MCSQSTVSPKSGDPYLSAAAKMRSQSVCSGRPWNIVKNLKGVVQHETNDRFLTDIPEMEQADGSQKINTAHFIPQTREHILQIRLFDGIKICLSLALGAL